MACPVCNGKGTIPVIRPGTGHLAEPVIERVVCNYCNNRQQSGSINYMHDRRYQDRRRQRKRSWSERSSMD